MVGSIIGRQFAIMSMATIPITGYLIFIGVPPFVGFYHVMLGGVNR